MTVPTTRRRLVPVLFAALVALVFSLSATTPARADGTVLDPTGPCYVSPGVCLGFDATTRTFTAFSLIDVTTTPYYLSIYNLSTGTLLRACGTGTSCQTYPMGPGPRGFCHAIRAYIGTYSSAPPPATVVRESVSRPFCGRPF